MNFPFRSSYSEHHLSGSSHVCRTTLVHNTVPSSMLMRYRHPQRYTVRQQFIAHISTHNIRKILHQHISNISCVLSHVISLVVAQNLVIAMTVSSSSIEFVQFPAALSCSSFQVTKHSHLSDPLAMLQEVLIFSFKIFMQTSDNKPRVCKNQPSPRAWLLPVYPA